MGLVRVACGRAGVEGRGAGSFTSDCKGELDKFDFNDGVSDPSFGRDDFNFVPFLFAN